MLSPAMECIGLRRNGSRSGSQNDGTGDEFFHDPDERTLLRFFDVLSKERVPSLESGAAPETQQTG